MSDMSVRQIIDDLRSAVEEDMQTKIDRILLTHKQKGDIVQVLIDAVADGSTDAWLLSIHMSNALEDMLDGTVSEGTESTSN